MLELIQNSFGGKLSTIRKIVLGSRKYMNIRTELG